MQTGRADLDAVLKVSTIPSNEPVFILRAQDPQAADTARAWASLHLAGGGSEAVAESALQQADAMDQWPIKKLPSDGHWTESERLQLVYLFNQRAYRARGDDADFRIRLAEQRGHALARSQMRAFLKGTAVREVIAMTDGDCRDICELFRETGEPIERKPQAEKTFVWQWLLTLALDHGDRWKAAMAREIDRRRVTIAMACHASGEA